MFWFVEDSTERFNGDSFYPRFDLYRRSFWRGGLLLLIEEQKADSAAVWEDVLPLLEKLTLIESKKVAPSSC